MMDCMIGRMFPSSPPPSPPSSNPRPSRVLTRSSPASPEVYMGISMLVKCLHSFDVFYSNWLSLILPTCRLSAFLAMPRRVSLRQEVNSCWEAVSVPAEDMWHLETGRRVNRENMLQLICRLYQLFLQPPIVFENAAVALAPPGPAQTWPSPIHPWLGQPCHPQRESQRICSLQAGEATRVRKIYT